MKIDTSIYLFLKKKYTYNSVRRVFKNLNLEDFNLTTFKKSWGYDPIDCRYCAAEFSFRLNGIKLLFDVIVDEDTDSHGVNVIELELKNWETYNYVCNNSDVVIPVFKQLKKIEGVALVIQDVGAPGNDFYNRFKKGEFNLYLS